MKLVQYKNKYKRKTIKIYKERFIYHPWQLCSVLNYLFICYKHTPLITQHHLLPGPLRSITVTNLVQFENTEEEV